MDNVSTGQFIIQETANSDDPAVSATLEEEATGSVPDYCLPSFADLLLHYITRGLTLARFRMRNQPANEETRWTIPLLFIGRYVLLPLFAVSPILRESSVLQLYGDCSSKIPFFSHLMH